MLVPQPAYIVTVIKSHSDGCLSSLSTKGKGASCEERKKFKSWLYLLHLLHVALISECCQFGGGVKVVSLSIFKSLPAWAHHDMIQAVLQHFSLNCDARGSFVRDFDQPTVCATCCWAKCVCLLTFPCHCLLSVLYFFVSILFLHQLALLSLSPVLNLKRIFVDPEIALH